MVAELEQRPQNEAQASGFWETMSRKRRINSLLLRATLDPKAQRPIIVEKPWFPFIKGRARSALAWGLSAVTTAVAVGGFFVPSYKEAEEGSAGIEISVDCVPNVSGPGKHPRASIRRFEASREFYVLVVGNRETIYSRSNPLYRIVDLHFEAGERPPQGSRIAIYEGKTSDRVRGQVLKGDQLATTDLPNC